MAVLGLHFCARAFSSCGERGPLFIAVRGPLTIAASLVAEHRLQTRRLSSCGSRAQLLRGMWDLPRPGLEPVSPALAGRFSTTEPPGKPHASAFLCFSEQQESSKIFPTLQVKLTNHYTENESKFASGASWLYLCLLKFTSFHLKTTSPESLTEYKLFHWDVRKEMSPKS